jgi:hypothetical protein
MILIIMMIIIIIINTKRKYIDKIAQVINKFSYFSQYIYIHFKQLLLLLFDAILNKYSSLIIMNIYTQN